MIWAHLQTIFSFRAYHRLVRMTRLQTVGFVAYLCILSLVVFYFFSAGFIGKNLPVFLKNFPQVTFEKGQLTSPRQPVYAPFPHSPLKIAFDASRQTPPSNEELLANNWLALVGPRTLYVAGSGGVQTRPIPGTLSATTSQEFLAQHKPLISSALKATALFAALFFIPLMLLFDFCIAAAVGLFFNMITGRQVPRSVIWRWAVLLLGPLSVLWYIRMWYFIPLFALAQIILCIIYMQQIFNSLPETK
ncbi:MAG: DUF1189 domain-containing protein [Elusimicrobiaceae bacterium]|nr:DUF1189 domain-containing protein [Elusimicrobiaceae bacterium]